jgi:hypothetical protein
MILPDNFSFSQNNLQDYEDCQYRFLLRHVQHLDWPAVESEPLQEQEKKIELGYQFHRLVQQYFSGIDARLLSSSIPDPELTIWWKHFLDLDLLNQPGTRYCEKMLSVPLNEFRLVAKYDLLLLEIGGKVIIYDWKTSSFQPSRQHLANRMQSRVYPALLILQHEFLSAIPVESPESIEMIYWYPSFSDSPVTFRYSQNKFYEDLNFITRLIEEIRSKTEIEFVKTDETKKCNFCRYRSLCNRGISASMRTKEEDFQPEENPFDFDFNSI